MKRRLLSSITSNSKKQHHSLIYKIQQNPNIPRKSVENLHIPRKPLRNLQIPRTRPKKQSQFH